MLTCPDLGGIVIEPAEWVLYVSPSGHKVVEAEIEGCKLSKSEVAQLSKLLDRVRDGRVFPRDVKYLKAEGLHEARLDGDRRIFRLLFAKRKGTAVLVGLSFTAKKRDRLPESVFSAARKRLKDWDSRHPQ